MARGGIDITATFSYYVQPKINIEGSVELPDIGSESDSDTQLSTKEPTISSTSCLSLYDGWDIYGEIYPYYELRHISFGWYGFKVMDHTYHHNDRLVTCCAYNCHAQWIVLRKLLCAKIHGLHMNCAIHELQNNWLNH